MKFVHLLVVQLLLLPKLSAKFHSGRIKPGKFEYPKLNGRMPIWQAVKKCQEDIACGGFTFKGSYRSKELQMEVYFFHLVNLGNNQPLKMISSLKGFVKKFSYLPLKFPYLQNVLENDFITKEAHYYHWSTYVVERDYVHMSHLRVRSQPQYSKRSKQVNDDNKQM